MTIILLHFFAALPLSPSSVLQQSALQNIAEFSALVLERHKPFLGKRIDIASDEVTGEQAASFHSYLFTNFYLLSTDFMFTNSSILNLDIIL